MKAIAGFVESALGSAKANHALVFWLRAYKAGLWDKNIYPDVIIDQHAYPGNCNSDTFSANSNMPFAQQYGQGWLLDEWGGMCDPEPYNCDVVKVAQSGDMGVAYFAADDVYDQQQGQYILNALGMEVKGDYGQLAGGPVVCP